MAAKKKTMGKCKECGGADISVGDLKSLQSDNTALRLEIDELQEIISTQNPAALIARKPKVDGVFYPALCQKIIAGGIVGKSPDEMRSSLGISKPDWVAWKSELPDFKAACERHRTHCHAFWWNKSRKAMMEGNWAFQADKVERLLIQMFKGEDTDALGDASTLVRIVDTPHMGKS